MVVAYLYVNKSTWCGAEARMTALLPKGEHSAKESYSIRRHMQDDRIGKIQSNQET